MLHNFFKYTKLFEFDIFTDKKNKIIVSVNGNSKL